MIVGLVCARLVYVYVFFLLCTNVCTGRHMGVSVRVRSLHYCVSVYVFVCPCQCMLFPLSPLAVCVCHYPAGAALMEAVISNAVN